MNENHEIQGHKNHPLSKSVGSKSVLLKICWCSCTHAKQAPDIKFKERFEHKVLAFSKDLESLLHQPDPSLTVQELPQNPQISFRKGSHILDQNTIESEETTVTPPFQG